MSCFICGENSDSSLRHLKSKNDVKLDVCKLCYTSILGSELICSCCGRVVFNDEPELNGTTNVINAHIGRNGIICSACVENGIKVLGGKCTFSVIRNNYRGYTYKPDPVFHKAKDDNDELFMGVELEIGGLSSYDKVNEFCDNHGGQIFYFKSDGSIRGAGCEIVTHPATLQYHLSDESGWRELFEDFNSDGFVSGTSTNTGLHIHINKNLLTQSQIKKIDLVVNYWQSLFKNIGRRSNDQYCRYNIKRHSEWGTSNDRYQSVNFSNRNTVEFRFFNGTNNVEELFASLESVKVLVIMSKDISYDILYEDEDAVKEKLKQVAKENNFTYFSKMMARITGDSTWQI